MNILLITSSYPPEVRSSSHLMQELAEELKDRGYVVTVATSYPYHNIADSERQLHFESVTHENGVEVIRIKTLPSHGISYLLRGLSQLLLPYVFLHSIKRYVKRRIDVVIVYSPPLTLAIAGKSIKKTTRAKYILNLQDLFPQNAIDLRILKNGFLIKLFKRIEVAAYRNADVISVHSESNKSFLDARNDIMQDKVQVIHNWIDVQPYSKTPRTGRFRKVFNLDDKFIFLFAGVMGPSQGLDLIIKVAEKITHLNDICFLLVGDGMEKGRLEKMKEYLQLRNVIFKPFVSKDEYPELAKDADIGLVCLSSMNKTPVVPGKILGYMAASVPVAAFLNKESDGHKIIRDANCGFSAISDDVERAVETVIKIYDERSRLKEYGENGFNYVRENFEKNVCIDQLEKLFKMENGCAQA